MFSNGVNSFVGFGNANPAPPKRDRDDSLEILRRRLAEGDIDYDEYVKLKEVLMQQ